MYAQVEKTNENKSRAVANFVAQKKSKGKQGLEFVDNRIEKSNGIVQRVMSYKKKTYTSAIEITMDTNGALDAWRRYKEAHKDAVSHLESKTTSYSMDEFEGGTVEYGHGEQQGARKEDVMNEAAVADPNRVITEVEVEDEVTMEWHKHKVGNHPVHLHIEIKGNGKALNAYNHSDISIEKLQFHLNLDKGAAEVIWIMADTELLKNPKDRLVKEV